MKKTALSELSFPPTCRRDQDAQELKWKWRRGGSEIAH